MTFELKRLEMATETTSLPRRIWSMYYDGFRNMTIGKYLWIIILAKLAVMFLVFKLFFFPNILERDYSTDEERADAVRTHLTSPKE